MSRVWLWLAVGLGLPGCATGPAAPERGEIMARILPSTVQLRAERAGGARRAASGVVLASDAASNRSWIVTTRHFLEPDGEQQLFVGMPNRKGRVTATVALVSDDSDLAVLEVSGLSLPPVALKLAVRLGDEVWVAAFPFGRQLTVVSGVVSQLVAEEGELPLEGTIRMVDASVSYGASGGGVFDAGTGALVGIVEGYRTVNVSSPERPERPLKLPVAGETTVIPATGIVRFLTGAGRGDLIRR